MKKVELSQTEWLVLKELIDGLLICEKPFLEIAKKHNLSQEEVFEAIKSLLQKRVITRLGITLRHNLAGIEGNAMVAWKVEEERAEEVGQALAQRPYISHCYLRKTYPDWPYNLYTMVHGKSREEVLSVVKEISEEFGLKEYEILFTQREIVRKHAKYALTL
ncbi:Lrp/AsnC family transcriptional regulator [Thermodesulfobacterium hveragerdense]|uniref:siroheme decarboxylase subunit beta n=1 Tax=Thermodesulfobacterium hveragerdense TaxID=53424 RepID=UPI0004046E13|nr:Lrp/AsnC family transcriptional regulator [Thermodesulfobacterium hveragerdense]